LSGLNRQEPRRGVSVYLVLGAGYRLIMSTTSG
jgi:hypothetical protein